MFPPFSCFPVRFSPRIECPSETIDPISSQLYGPFNSYSRAVYAELIPPVSIPLSTLPRLSRPTSLIYRVTSLLTFLYSP